MTGHINRQHQSPAYQTWRQFRQNKPALVSLYVLAVLVLIALLAPLLANQRPLFAVYKGETIFPFLHPNKTYIFIGDDGKEERIQCDIANWKNMELEKVVWAPIPYSPCKDDYANAHFKAPGDEQYFTSAKGGREAMPGRFRHVLGTNNTGEDVAAGLIHGTRISLSIGFIAMGIASLIGLTLGALAGFLGDHSWRLSRGVVLGLLAGLFLAWFYGLRVRRFQLSDALESGTGALLWQLLISGIIAASVIALCIMVGKALARWTFFSKKVRIPVDSMVSRSIEVIHSLPVFILILTIAAIARPSLTNIMIIIGLTSWTGIARFTRAEFLKVRQLDYIAAANSLGFSRGRIMLRHALPNCLAPALVSIAFGIAAAILVESSLSFLGVGVPPDVVTWGSMVNEGRQQYSAWWLVIFPGLLIFLTVTAYNLIGESLRDALDPRLKR